MKEKMKKKEYIRFDRTPFKPLTKEEKEMEKIGVLLLIDSLKVKGKDNMKEKIEENRYFEVPNVPIHEVLAITKDGTKYQLKEVKLSTLIQAERKEAVRGLIEYLEVNTDKVFYLGCGKMINEYLGTVESEGIEREKK